MEGQVAPSSLHPNPRRVRTPQRRVRCDIRRTRDQTKIRRRAGREITSAPYSPGLGKGVALACVRMEYLEPGTEMTSGDLRARVPTS